MISDVLHERREGSMTAPPDVDTKSAESAILVTTGPGVDTKCPADKTFGNYGLGFVRVRKRALKGGHPSYRWRTDKPTTATTFDVVRAVRVNGKPRHKFVFGLGSLKDKRRDYELPCFWQCALHTMRYNGLDVAQRRALANELMRKGAPSVALSKLRSWFGSDPSDAKDLSEILSWFADKMAA